MAKHSNGELILRVNNPWVLIAIGYWFTSPKISVFDSLPKASMFGLIELNIILANEIPTYMYTNNLIINYILYRSVILFYKKKSGPQEQLIEWIKIIRVRQKDLYSKWWSEDSIIWINVSLSQLSKVFCLLHQQLDSIFFWPTKQVYIWIYMC